MQATAKAPMPISAPKNGTPVSIVAPKNRSTAATIAGMNTAMIAPPTVPAFRPPTKPATSGPRTGIQKSRSDKIDIQATALAILPRRICFQFSGTDLSIGGVGILRRISRSKMFNPIAQPSHLSLQLMNALSAIVSVLFGTLPLSLVLRLVVVGVHDSRH